jgi:hypothetical protein
MLKTLVIVDQLFLYLEEVEVYNTALLSCRIFEHFATKPDPVIEFIKLRSTIIFKHFATNQIQ